MHHVRDLCRETRAGAFMTPDQLSGLVALATILKTVGSLPFGMVLVFIFIGPWAGMLVSSSFVARRTADATDTANRAIATQNDRISQTAEEFRQHVADLVASQEKRFDKLVNAQEKRFESVVRMYENNVKVVEDYNALATDLTSIITLSTRTMESLVGKIDNNQFCPIVRKETGK